MILVTGGCGYIGSHVVKTLTQAGEEVVVFDDLSHGQKSALLHDEKLVIGDIRNRDDLSQVFATHKITAIIHLAALINALESLSHPSLYEQVNQVGSQNVWEEGQKAGVGIYLYASSAAVYGAPQSPAPIQENAPLIPSNPYGATKLAGEQSLALATQDRGRYLAFRFFNVGGAEEQGRLGPSLESSSIISRLFCVASGKEPKITINGHDYATADGTVVRDFVHVEDIAQAFVLGLAYLRRGGTSQILNLGSGNSHTLGDVIKEVELVTGQTIPLDYGPRIEGDISYSLADVRLANKLLGWHSVHTLHSIVSDGWNSYVLSQR